ncbi:MAG: DNA-processing protein DprA [Saccharofermentanales bacterium]
MKTNTINGIDRLAVACAFSEACIKSKVEHSTRVKIIQKAGGLSGIEFYLASTEQSVVLYKSFLTHYNTFDHRDKADIQVTTIVDHDYPVLLKEISRPPAILFWKGKSLMPLSGPCVIAVVGSRHPSVYGLEVTRHFVSGIARLGIPIVSGGARGIDGETHRTALREDGLTFCVLGCGVDVVYPAEHRRLFDQITEKGALISEYLPGKKPLRHFFPARNRIISGLCHTILVTEASKASGTLITAGFAADQGRDVCAVPGSIISGSSHSCHQLIREGAILVETLHDIPALSEANTITSLAAVNQSQSNPQQSRNKENSSVMSDSVVCIYTLNKEKHKGNLPEDPAGSLKYITAQNTTRTGGLEPEEDTQICEMAQTLPILVERKAAQSAERSSKCKTTQTSMTPKEHKIGQEKDISDPREMEQLSKSLKKCEDARKKGIAKTRSADAQKLLEILDAAPRSLSLLTVKCQFSARKTALILSELQCEGVVKLHRGLYQRVHFKENECHFS